jgi:hypothetical protein
VPTDQKVWGFKSLRAPSGAYNSEALPSRWRHPLAATAGHVGPGATAMACAQNAGTYLGARHRTAQFSNLSRDSFQYVWNGSNQNHAIWYGSTTNFAVTLPSTPADQGEQRRTVTNTYSQVTGMHE